MKRIIKQKTRKTVKKRFKITAGGKMLRGHAYSSHLKRKKSSARIRRQKEPTEIFSGVKKKIKALAGG